MAKYIDVESLVVGYSGHTPDDEFSKGVDFVLDLLDSKPPADVKPVVRGEWEHDKWGFDYDRCSVCGYKHRYPGPFYFCPNCGADTRETSDE